MVKLSVKKRPDWIPIPENLPEDGTPVEIDLDTGKIKEEKPKRKVKVRDPETQGYLKTIVTSNGMISCEDTKDIEKLKEEHQKVCDRFMQELAEKDRIIAELRSQSYIDNHLDFKKAVLLQNLEQMKTYFRQQGNRPPQEHCYRTMKENIENL